MSFLSRLFRPKQTRPIPVLFGSQTGNAEQLARMVAKRIDTRLRATGSQAWHAQAQSLARFASITWEGTPLALFVTSTYGQGELPDNGARFWQWLTRVAFPPCGISAMPCWVSATGPTRIFAALPGSWTAD